MIPKIILTFEKNNPTSMFKVLLINDLLIFADMITNNNNWETHFKVDIKKGIILIIQLLLMNKTL